MKKCSDCNEEKPLDSFHKNKTKADGYQHVCKECKAQRHKDRIQKEGYQKNKEVYRLKNAKRRDDWRRWLLEFKSSLCCVECGENHPSCLEFHHRNPEDKDFNIAGFATKQMFNDKKQQVILKEIDKCDVLCSNCHRKRHWIEGGYYKNVI